MKRTNLKTNRVPHWLKRLDNLIGNRRYDFAQDTLKGIRKTIKKNKEVTDAQIEAIKNIRYGSDHRAESF